MNILLAEDDADVTGFLTKGLIEEGYSVTAFSDGKSALSKSKEKHFDLFILDIMMPEIDGISLCSALRANGIMSPVIILTARNSVQDKVDGLEAGADDYLVKPFDFNELLARIKALLRRSRNYSATILTYADLTLDPVSRTAERNRKKIKLSLKEFTLLEFFMNNRERLVTEEEIIRNVWSSNVDPLTNIVNVYVHHLRSKIDKNHTVKLLHTIRGTGYIFEERK